MRKIVFINLLLLFVCFKTFSQNIYLKTGLNQTTYDFKDQNGEKVSGLFPGMGSSFDLGVGLPFAQDWLRYDLGLSLDSYNATGGDLSNNYSWNTNYGGIKNTVSFIPTTGDLSLGVLGLLGVSKILNGSQTLNNARYDLRTNPEFNGVFFQAGLGLSLSYNIFNQGFLSLQYDYTKSFRVGERTDEKLSYINNRILFGIHFQFD